MSLWRIAWRSIEQRALSSTLTGLSMALGVALVVAVLVVYGVVDRSFRQAAGGYNLIVGAKGGKLQLVLNTVFHLSTPIENVPYHYYKEFLPGGKFASQVDQPAVPYCLGDNYEGFRVVGTTRDLFEQFEYAPGERYRFAEGRNFEADHYFEAVIGSLVSRRTGLKVGDEFAPTHGVSENSEGHKHDNFRVVGILAPTGTPNDRALFVNVEGFYLLEGHAKDGAPLVRSVATQPNPHGGDHNGPHSGDADQHSSGHDGHDHHVSEDAHAKHQSDDASHVSPATTEHELNHAFERAAQETQSTDGATIGPGENPFRRPDGAVNDELRPTLAPDSADDHAQPADDGHDSHDHSAAGAHEHAEGKEHAPRELAAESDGNDHAAHDHDSANHAAHDHPGHDHHDHAPLPEDQREVTAILVRTALGNPLAARSLYQRVNEDVVAQAVFPVVEVFNLFEGIVGNVRYLLLALAVLVVIVAAIGILVSIYNSMNERRREIAVMRALGASRWQVMAIVLLESVILALAGGLAGVVVGHGLIGVLSPWILDQTGVVIGPLQFDRLELILIPGLIILATLAGYIPALTAYRTDVAKALSAAP